MNLHEYQAKKLFAEYGMPVPPGQPAFSIGEALEHATALGGDAWIVKAQVHAGGRGKAGGVRAVEGRAALEACVRELLGSRLVTHQSGPSGQPVNCVLVQRRERIQRELYLGMLVDRSRHRLAVMASAAGGMDIEQVAAETPERIHTLHLDPVLGLLPYQARRLGFALELTAEQRRQLEHILQAMHRLYLDKDVQLIEINPLVVDGAGQLAVLDAKLTIDDNALFRQASLAEWHDPDQEEPREREAKRHDLSYVALGGTIGCMVNGAGLAMATMDIIKLHGGEPANFLDVGGNATVERVCAAFRLILADAQVRAILVNIFGGIVRCDLIAEGILAAAREVGVQLPLVVRLEGTNAAEGRRLLRDSGLSLHTAEGLAEAAEQAVAAAA